MKHFLLIFLFISIVMCLWIFAPKPQKRQISAALKKYAKPISVVFAVTFVAMAIAIHFQAIKLF